MRVRRVEFAAYLIRRDKWRQSTGLLVDGASGIDGRGDHMTRRHVVGSGEEVQRNLPRLAHRGVVQGDGGVSDQAAPAEGVGVVEV
jgi:hypothetical protein